MTKPSPRVQTKFIVWFVQRSSCKAVIILALGLILILDALYGKSHEQTSTATNEPSSEGFSLFASSNIGWNTTAATGDNAASMIPLGFVGVPPEGQYVRSSTIDSKLFENSRDIQDQPITTVGRYKRDIPFFWSIPKSGTSTIKAILCQCLNLRMASSTGQIRYESYDKIQLVKVGGVGGHGNGPRGGHYVNVNFGYLEGIQKAKEWKMAESGLVDVAVTSYIHEGVDALDPSHPARVFTILRHPVLRLISDFYYQKVAIWEKTFDGSRDTNLTLLEYASDSQFHVDNWMTRMLSKRHDGPLKDDDFLYAKRVLKEKVLILLLDEIDESVARLLAFMAWEDRIEQSPPDNGGGRGGGLGGGSACVNLYLHSEPQNAHRDDRNVVLETSKEWQMLKDRNKYDLDLYLYGKDLFDREQRELYNNLTLG